MLSPKGGGGSQAYVGHLTFQKNFQMVKIPSVGPQNLVKSDQISPTFQPLIFWQKAS